MSSSSSSSSSSSPSLSRPKVFDIILIGDNCSGKTTFLKRHLGEEFDENYHPTDLDVHMLKFDSNTNTNMSRGPIILRITDVSGSRDLGEINDGYHERLHEILDGFILFVSNPDDETLPFLDRIKELCPNIPGVLVRSQHVINPRYATPKWLVEISTKTKFPFFDIDAKTGSNCMNPFVSLVQTLMKEPDLQLTSRVFEDTSTPLSPNTPLPSTLSSLLSHFISKSELRKLPSYLEDLKAERQKVDDEIKLIESQMKKEELNQTNYAPIHIYADADIE